MRTESKHLGLGLTTIACLTIAFQGACKPADDKAASSSSASSSGEPGTDSGTDGPTGEEGGSSGTLPPAAVMHQVTGVNGDERVSGIYCAPGATMCVIAANGSNARIAATTGTAVAQTPILVGDDALAAKIGMIGGPRFLGFQKVAGKVIALLDTGARGFISATGDPTVAASWQVAKLGAATPDDFGLNHQYGFGFDGTTWVQMRHNSGIYTASGTPTTGWVNIWGPGGAQDLPADIDTRKAADATLCNSSVSYSVSPSPVQAGYVAPNAEIILYPAGAVNAIKAPDGAGICISTDKGVTFHIVKLAAEETADHRGPTAVTCITKDKCFVGGGQVSSATSAYLYYTDNASAGAMSTWKKATIPTQVGDEFINSIFFAPDGTHGWAVGAKNGTHALVLTTTDGGHTWTDTSATVSGLGTDSELYSGFASDATHVMIGGKSGALVSTF